MLKEIRGVREPYGFRYYVNPHTGYGLENTSTQTGDVTSNAACASCDLACDRAS